VERVYTSPRIDKLGVKPGMRVAVIGLQVADDFLRELRERSDDIALADAPTDETPKPDTDLVFLAADSHAELGHLDSLRARLKPNGAIWVVSRKGKSATLTYHDVLQATLAAQLVDNKVVSFDATRTSLRLVIPLALRPKV
jgi:hypothetical protein